MDSELSLGDGVEEAIVAANDDDDVGGIMVSQDLVLLMWSRDGEETGGRGSDLEAHHVLPFLWLSLRRSTTPSTEELRTSTFSKSSLL